MLPIGPLMIEHRLIERMISMMRAEQDRMRQSNDADPAFLETAVDFIKTYADRCHHGKEEDILFTRLEAKPLTDEHRKTMQELIDEHRWARKIVGRLVDAKNRYQQGEQDALLVIQDCIGALVEFYPKHIEKEDKHFFMPIMKYLTESEREAMLDAENEFDRNFVHETYRRVIETVENRKEKGT